MELAIPSGYSVEELSEQINLSLPNNGGLFQYFIKETGGRIQLVRKVTINQLKVLPEEYKAIKSFFDLIVEKQGEQIVLKKKMTDRP